MIKIWFIMEGLLWSEVLDNENMFCENSSWKNTVILYCRSEIVREFATFLLKIMHLGIFFCVNYAHMILK
jgi:hypothetical protein